MGGVCLLSWLKNGGVDGEKGEVGFGFVFFVSRFDGNGGKEGSD